MTRRWPRPSSEAGPDVVFNCAAFHNVEVCEREEDRSFEVNARAVKRLAERCTESGAKFVHLSTNYVFDGTAPDPYPEDDPPSPRSIYALSEAGRGVRGARVRADALVARGAGLYGLHGSASKGGNFVTRMVARAREQGRAQDGRRPAPEPDLHRRSGRARWSRRWSADAAGLVHLTAGGECSWFEFTQAIMELAGIEVPVEPVTTTRPPGGADRPLNGVLQRPSPIAAGLTPLRHWRDGLADYMSAAGLQASVR